MTISNFITQFPYPGMFILLILGGLGLPFPEDAILILCGLLISTGVIRLIPALLTVYSGLLIADLTLHMIGRKFGRQILTTPRFGKILSPERLNDLEGKFNRWGILILLFGRHLPGLRAQLFLVSGVLKMPRIKFLLTDACASLISMTLMIGAGYLGGNSLKVLKNDFSHLEHWGILLLIAALIIYSGYRYFKPGAGKAHHG
jgi:membrane protein DedA with SNARE-associated domain